LRASKGTLVPALVMGSLVLFDQAAERGWLTFLAAPTLGARMVRSFATPIGLGALLALAGGDPRSSRFLDGVLARRWSSSVALALVVLAIVQPWSIFSTHVVLAFLVYASARRRDHWLAPVFENRILRHVGVVSYGMYLLNVPVVTCVKTILGADAHVLA